jgi:hypothetical protein
MNVPVLLRQVWKGSPDKGDFTGLAQSGQDDNLEFLHKGNGFGCQGSFDRVDAPYAGKTVY